MLIKRLGICIILSAVLGIVPVISVALMSVAAVSPETERGGTRYVGPEGDCSGHTPCHSTIQQAIDAADPHDAIIVLDGTYYENVQVNKANLTIQSQNGSGSTSVYASNPSEHVFDITANDITIIGFDIGYAFDCVTGSNGVRIQSNSIRLEDNLITNNCDGIYLLLAEHVTIKDNIVRENNVSSSSDGIYIFFSEYITITGNTISSSGDEGIQLGQYGLHFWIESNQVLDNESGGIFLRTQNGDFPSSLAEALTFSHDYTIKDNVVGRNGGNGIDLGLMPTGNVISGNDIFENMGSGIIFGGDSRVYEEFPYEVTFVSEYNRLERNRLADNVVGIQLAKTANNHIYLNDLVDNNQNAVGAYPMFSGNTWHSNPMTYTYQEQTYTEAFLGNYWSDYDGQDTDGDGIGEQSVVIVPVWDLDLYPLVEPHTNYVDDSGDQCYDLVLSHTGYGSDPLAAPGNSPGCQSGHYVAGQAITLTAAPAATWIVSGWQGTDDDASTSISNCLTMLAAPHQASVFYVRGAAICLPVILNP